MSNFKDNIRKVDPYVPGEQSKDKDIIKLNANENPYPPSPEVEKVINEYKVSTLKKYPSIDAFDFKSAIANFYGVNAENVFIGNGSDDVLALSFQTFFNSELPIVYPDITYSFYPVWCRLFNIPYVTYPLDKDFRINIEDYKSSNGGVVFPNPNAPTSICEGTNFIEKMLDYNKDCVVIVDEAYVDFGGVSSIPLIDKYENLLVTGTFSKSRSLAGLRIGFAIGSKTLIDALEAVKNSYNSYTVDSISMAAGIASMNDTEYFNETINKIIKTRDNTKQKLRDLGFEVLESSSNFLMATHPSFSMKEMFEFLKTQKVFIRYFNLPRISNYVRITVGTDEEMDAFMSGVKKFLEEKN